VFVGNLKAGRTVAGIEPIGHLKTSEVGQVLERTVRRIDKYLRRRGLVELPLLRRSGARCSQRHCSCAAQRLEPDARHSSRTAAQRQSGRANVSSTRITAPMCLLPAPL
jgi:hypothetical protein